MAPQGTIIEESHEDNLASLKWQEIAENSDNFVTFESIIEELQVDPANEEDKLPAQLLEVANTILYISLGIKSVKSHKEDFDRLLYQATSLVVVFWHVFVNEGIPASMWPPVYLSEVTDRLSNTVYFIHKLMTRKSQRNFAKRVVVGYFGLRDRRKFKKYQRKLGSVAAGFESEPNNVNISEVLLEVIKSRKQRPIEGEGSQPLEKTAGLLRKNKGTADKEASAEGSRLRKGKARVEDGDSSDDENKTAKKTTRRQPEAHPGPKGTRGANFDENISKRTRYQDPDEDADEGTFRQGSRTNNAARVSPVQDDEDDEDDEDMNDSMYEDDDERDEEISNDDLPASKENLKRKPFPTPKKNVKSTPVSPQRSNTFNNGVEENTSRQGSQTKNGARSKTKKKKRPNPTPKQKVEPTPMSPPQYSNSFVNGSGNMWNHNVGNFNNSVVEDAFNDNSVNHFGRRKPA